MHVHRSVGPAPPLPEAAANNWIDYEGRFRARVSPPPRTSSSLLRAGSSSSSSTLPNHFKHIMGPAAPKPVSSQASAAFEALAKSLSDVEEALKQIALGETSPSQPSESPIYAPSSTYGKLTANSATPTKLNSGSQNLFRPQPPPSPMNLSIATSTTTTRADSRNTNQSYDRNAGPALVEEMTLSDLEDELSSSLMLAKENHLKYKKLFYQDQELNRNRNQGLESLLRSGRSRQPLPAALLSTTITRDRFDGRLQ